MLSALFLVGIVAYGFVVVDSWWLVLIVGLGGALAILAEVVEAERVETADDVVYEMVLRIPSPDGTAFDVEHRCSHYSCAAATRQSSTGQPVIVDPATRVWAVIH